VPRRFFRLPSNRVAELGALIPLLEGGLRTRNNRGTELRGAAASRVQSLIGRWRVKTNEAGAIVPNVQFDQAPPRREGR
jgi:hypothetical protein